MFEPVLLVKADTQHRCTEVLHHGAEQRGRTVFITLSALPGLMTSAPQLHMQDQISFSLREKISLATQKLTLVK